MSWSRDQGITTTHRASGKVPIAITNVHDIQQNWITQNWGEVDTEGVQTVMTALLWRRRYEIVGLTKHHDHTRTHVCSERLSSPTQSPPRLHWQTGISRNSLKRKEEKNNIFFFYKKESLLLLLYPMSILSSKVKHNGSIHKYTQQVKLTHY